MTEHPYKHITSTKDVLLQVFHLDNYQNLQQCSFVPVNEHPTQLDFYNLKHHFNNEKIYFSEPILKQTSMNMC